MTLTLYVPDIGCPEIGWIAGVLLGEFLGLDFVMRQAASNGYRLELDSKAVDLPAIFIGRSTQAWHRPQTMPILPFVNLDLHATGLRAPQVESPIPVLFGTARLDILEDSIKLGIDIFGSAFFMLSRYEETIMPDRDSHDRSPSFASTAFRAGFLDRPIVDEYVEVLWAVMHRLWPSLQRKVHRPRTLVSCDLDSPYVCSAESALVMVKRLGGDLLKRRSLGMAMQTLSSSLCGRSRDFSADPYLRAIDWIMDVNEMAGNRVAFYFIAAHSHPALDGCYNMDEPVIRDLMRRIASRGHEIGLHPSYNTYCDGTQTCREADILRQAMEEEGIHQEVIGSRQHYLRWQTPGTARNLQAARIDYDSTLSFADRPGFRCGTCHEYPMYDLTECRALKLRQRPLIVMESSVIAERYMGMGYSDEALKLMKSYKQVCHTYGGDFTLLWHNSHLTTENDKRFYLELIA